MALVVWPLIFWIIGTKIISCTESVLIPDIKKVELSNTKLSDQLFTPPGEKHISGAHETDRNQKRDNLLSVVEHFVRGKRVTKYNQHSASPKYATRNAGNKQIWPRFRKPSIARKQRVKRAVVHFPVIASSEEVIERLLQSKEKSLIKDVKYKAANNSCSHNSRYVNCSSRNLKNVPIEDFEDTIVWFDLHKNQIAKIENNSFIRYKVLHNLDLSSNYISCVSVDAFQGLSMLKKLYLWNNRLDLKTSPYHPDVFSPLISLEILLLNKNIQNQTTYLSYPDQALSKLVSLKVLQLDGLENTTFGPGFQNMTSLMNFSVSGYHDGYCKMTTLTNSTFVYLQHLQHLNLSSCNIKGKFIEAGAFSPLRSLVSLDLTHNEDIDISNLDKVFYGLHETETLRHLKMHLIVNRYSVGICLDSSYIKYFPKYLESFDAQENNLEALDRQVISKLSPSLKTLDISGNRFVFGTYLLDLYKMKNLTSVKINGGSFVYNLPSLYPYELSAYRLSSNCTLYGNSGFRMYKPFVLELPPNLKNIEMNYAGLKYILSELNATKNNLKHLSLRGNFFSNLIGPFHGFHKLETLDLSFCQVKSISPQFFPSFPNLKILDIKNNQLGDFFSERQESSVFSSLNKLNTLDLSSNGIRKLPYEIFSKLSSLRVLILANNSMSNFSFDITSLTNLMVLDLSHNQISTLPAGARKFIDFHLTTVDHMIIDMAQCSILCECVNLEFLRWMTSSRAFNDSFHNYLCVKEDSSIMPITDGYNSTLDELEHACTSHITMFFFVGAGTLLMFSVILGGIIYRFRWKIRYLYYAAYLLNKKSDRRNDTGFQYDAFVSYDHSDEHFVVKTLCCELESRDLKLCIHGRDFKAGDYIASNVVKAVCSSRKTVVVLTRSMVKSYWCGYEIQMANMESVHTGRQVLIFLIMEKMATSDLGVELLYNIRNNTYLPYPENQQDGGGLKTLWDKLANDIKE